MRNGKRPDAAPKPKPVPQLKPHQWTKGQSGNPRGRPKGQVDKVHLLQLEAAARGEHMPLDILLAIARKDPVALREMGIELSDCTLNIRRAAAESALPYIHRRMPIALDVEVSKERAIPAEAWATLSDEELEQYIRVTEHLDAVMNGRQPESITIEPVERLEEEA